MDNREFCFHLERWKEENGKKDIDFCRQIGIHPNTLVNWKKGNSVPQSTHMELICRAFGINEVDLTPLSFYTAQDNQNKLYYRTRQLQQYARRKGLDEDFYKRIINEPFFLREFPFSSVQDRFSNLECPEWLSEDKEYVSALHSIPLSKYEFSDDSGKIIMLTEDDIDFLVEIQQKEERMIRNEFFIKWRELQKKREMKFMETMTDIYYEEGNEITAKELYERLTDKIDFDDQIQGGPDLHERFEEYAKEHNLKMRHIGPTEKEVEIKHPPMTDDEKQAWKEHYIAAGLTEEEAEQKIRSREDLRQWFIQTEMSIYNNKKDGGESNGEY